MVLSRVGVFANYVKHWIVQISLLAFINSIKLLGINSRFSTRYILNNLFSTDKKLVDNLIINGNIEYTKETNILHKIHVPTNDKYPKKIIMYVGGRNSYASNYEFSSRISQTIGIKVLSFQYDGYYRSGKSVELSEETYIKTIEEMYDLIPKDLEIYMIGYSLGCYGAFLKNRKEKIMFISPFASLQHAIRNTIIVKEFNLINSLTYKSKCNIVIHVFDEDLITPISHLDGEFKRKNIKIVKHWGNHVSGLSDVLMDDIKDYIEDIIPGNGEIEMVDTSKV